MGSIYSSAPYARQPRATLFVVLCAASRSQQQRVRSAGLCRLERKLGARYQRAGFFRKAEHSAELCDSSLSPGAAAAFFSMMSAFLFIVFEHPCHRFAEFVGCLSGQTACHATVFQRLFKTALRAADVCASRLRLAAYIERQISVGILHRAQQLVLRAALSCSPRSALWDDTFRRCSSVRLIAPTKRGSSFYRQHWTCSLTSFLA